MGRNLETNRVEIEDGLEGGVVLSFKFFKEEFGCWGECSNRLQCKQNIRNHPQPTTPSAEKKQRKLLGEKEKEKGKVGRKRGRKRKRPDYSIA